MKVTAITLSGLQIAADADLAFANSAPADTQKTLDVAVPVNSPKNSYKLIVYNPSAVTDLTIKVFSKELLLKASTRYAFEGDVNVPMSQTIGGTAIDTHVFELAGAFAGADLRLIVSNNTALDVADGFTTTLRLRELT